MHTNVRPFYSAGYQGFDLLIYVKSNLLYVIILKLEEVSLQTCLSE